MEVSIPLLVVLIWFAAWGVISGILSVVVSIRDYARGKT